MKILAVALKMKYTGGWADTIFRYGFIYLRSMKDKSGYIHIICVRNTLHGKSHTKTYVRAK